MSFSSIMTQILSLDSLMAANLMNRIYEEARPQKLGNFLYSFQEVQWVV